MELKKVWIIAAPYTDPEKGCSANYWDVDAWQDDIELAQRFDTEKKAETAMAGIKPANLYSVRLLEIKPIFVKK